MSPLVTLRQEAEQGHVGAQASTLVLLALFSVMKRLKGQF